MQKIAEEGTHPYSLSSELPWYQNPMKISHKKENSGPVSLTDMGFPGDSTGKESACNTGDAGDTGLILGLRRSPGGGNVNLLQVSCLKNPTDKGAWQATVQRVGYDWACAHTHAHTHTHTHTHH